MGAKRNRHILIESSDSLLDLAFGQETLDIVTAIPALKNIRASVVHRYIAAAAACVPPNPNAGGYLYCYHFPRPEYSMSLAKVGVSQLPSSRISNLRRISQTRFGLHTTPTLIYSLPFKKYSSAEAVESEFHSQFLGKDCLACDLDGRVMNEWYWWCIPTVNNLLLRLFMSALLLEQKKTQ